MTTDLLEERAQVCLSCPDRKMGNEHRRVLTITGNGTKANVQYRAFQDRMHCELTEAEGLAQSQARLKTMQTVKLKCRQKGTRKKVHTSSCLLGLPAIHVFGLSLLASLLCDWRHMIDLHLLRDRRLLYWLRILSSLGSCDRLL